MLNESDNEADGDVVAGTSVGINISIDDDEEDEDEEDGHRETDALMRLSDRTPSPAAKATSSAAGAASKQPPPVVRWLGQDEDSD